jgi:hypothetical protein
VRHVRERHHGLHRRVLRVAAPALAVALVVVTAALVAIVLAALTLLAVLVLTLLALLTLSPTVARGVRPTLRVRVRRLAGRLPRGRRSDRVAARAGPVAGLTTGRAGLRRVGSAPFGATLAAPAAAAAAAATPFATFARRTSAVRTIAPIGSTTVGSTTVGTVALGAVPVGTTAVTAIGVAATGVGARRRRIGGRARRGIAVASGGDGLGRRDGGRFGLVHGAENDAQNGARGQGRSAHFPWHGPPA